MDQIQYGKLESQNMTDMTSSLHINFMHSMQRTYGNMLLTANIF
jgi:hypothetical protein